MLLCVPQTCISGEHFNQMLEGVALPNRVQTWTFGVGMALGILSKCWTKGNTVPTVLGLQFRARTPDLWLYVQP